MKLNTRSWSALEAGIDSSCNDRIQYSADAISYNTLWLALTLMFVLHIGELEFTSCLNTKLK